MNGARCQICQQQAARIHITQIHKDQLVEIHVCQDCARSNGLAGTALHPHSSLEELIGGMTAGEEAAHVESLVETKACPACGQTFRGFRESGRLGCSHCYDTFEEELVPLLRKVQMGMTHHGKVPPVEAPFQPAGPDLHKMREELRKAIAEEDFERAAQLRDAIKNLETHSKK